MRQPPTGTVTFLFTDIEGSTHLWDSNPAAMRPALARHDALLRQAITQNGGYVFKTVGDAFCAAFPTAPEALAAAVTAQLALAAEQWELPTPLRVRMALHTGAAEERGGDYFGPPLNRVARLLAVGHGGQTLLSLAAQELTRDAPPPSASLLDLGPHRLRDLGRPETVFQLLHPSLPAEFPPLRSLDSPDLPNNLPPQVTSFIGREAQVAEVKALLGRTRLLTLTGAGGTGKSRLSLQVASDLLDQYDGGVWLVELAGLSDPALVPQAVAAVLGVQEQAGKAMREAVTEWLRPKRLLLVLDNCEHLVAACASLAADLLRRCPDVRLLASSREPLTVAGEQTYRVPPLSLPDPNATRAQTAAGLSQYEAVRLFIERAQAVHPAFSVTDSNAPAVAQVCFHLDGIPLAIELAAARVRSLSAEEISRRLGQRFRLLTGGSRDTLPRQQTLRALIDWSYDLLTEAERALLCRLSVFSGGWTLEAAERVCAGDGVEDWEVLDLLTALVDKSLVVAEPWGERTRYRLLETVRQYAGERLGERGEADAVRDAHLAWCVALAEEADSHLSGPEQGAWLSRLEAEHDNLRAGLSWGGEAAADAGAERAQRLAGALGPFWAVRGHWTEGREHLRAAVAREGAASASAERVRALYAFGAYAEIQGDREEARSLYEQALAISQEVGDRSGEASCLGSLGNVSRQYGDLVRARSLREQALAIFRELGDRNNEAWSLGSLGNVSQKQGDWEETRSLFEQALAIYEEVGNRNGEAWCLSNLGVVSRQQGDLVRARSLHERALVIHRELGDRSSEASCLNNLADGSEQKGDWEGARALYEQALAIHRELKNRNGEAICLLNLGGVARVQGRLAEARTLLAEILTLERQLGTVWMILDTVEEWAALALAEGDAGRAARLAGAAQAGREALSASLPFEHGDTHERTLAGARAALGEGAFTAAWDAGRAMTLDEAVAYALGEG